MKHSNKFLRLPRVKKLQIVSGEKEGTVESHAFVTTFVPDFQKTKSPQILLFGISSLPFSSNHTVLNLNLLKK